MDEPTFFFIDTDLVSAEFPGSPAVPEHSYATYVDFLTGAQGAASFSPEAVDSMGYVQSIPVDPMEAVQWLDAHADFKSEVQFAHNELRQAMVRWNEAVARWHARLAAASAAYLPISEEIKHRKERVELDRQVHEERKAEAELLARKASLEAEEAVFGPREWMYVVAEPQRMPPIIHRVGCALVKKVLENQPSAYLRKTFGLIPLNLDETLAKQTEETRLCGRCKAKESLDRAKAHRR